MKFYQIIAFAILSIMYTATIFGPDPALPYVPEDICDLIDEFCGGENKSRKQELNDKYHEETGHLKPYSRLLDLTTSSEIPCTENPFKCTTIASVFGALILVFPRIIPKPTFVTALLYFNLATIIAWSTDCVVGKKLGNSHLTIKSPTCIFILDEREEIFVRNMSDNIVEIRSLSDMQLKEKRSLDLISSSANQDQDNFILFPHNELTYELLKKNGKIDIYLSNDCKLPKNGYKSGDKLCSLSTPAGVISFDVSKNNVIVALDEEGSLQQWKLQNRPSLHEILPNLHEIMDSE